MEKMPNFLDNSSAENEIPKNTSEENKQSTGGLKRIVGRTIAMGSVIGLGFFAGTDSLAAGEKESSTGDNTKIEHASKGSSLGAYYQKKFEQSDKEKANYKQALNRAKEILLDKGVSVTEKNKIGIELKGGILSKIIVDGVSIPVDDKYYSAEELKLIKSVNEVSKSMEKTSPTVKDGAKDNSIKTKSAVSSDADEFL